MSLPEASPPISQRRGQYHKPPSQPGHQGHPITNVWATDPLITLICLITHSIVGRAPGHSLLWPQTLSRLGCMSCQDSQASEQQVGHYLPPGVSGTSQGRAGPGFQSQFCQMGPVRHLCPRPHLSWDSWYHPPGPWNHIKITDCN